MDAVMKRYDIVEKELKAGDLRCTRSTRVAAPAYALGIFFPSELWLRASLLELRSKPRCNSLVKSPHSSEALCD